MIAKAQGALLMNFVLYLLKPEIIRGQLLPVASRICATDLSFL